MHEQRSDQRDPSSRTEAAGHTHRRGAAAGDGPTKGLPHAAHGRRWGSAIYLAAGHLLARTDGRLAEIDAGRPDRERAPFTSPARLQLGVEVADAIGNRQTKVFQLQVRRNTAPPPPPLKVTTHEVLPATLMGMIYQFTPAAEGGVPPYRWEIEAGRLPDGLQLSGNQITGKPTKATATAAKLTLRVADSQVPAVSTSKAVSIEVIEDWRGLLARWWKYFGFAAIVALYYMAKTVLLDWPFQRKVQSLLSQGLIIVQGPNPRLEGPHHLQLEFIRLQKQRGVQGNVLFVLALIVAAVYGVFSFYYLP